MPDPDLIKKMKSPEAQRFRKSLEGFRPSEMGKELEHRKRQLRALVQSLERKTHIGRDISSAGRQASKDASAVLKKIKSLKGKLGL